MLFYALLCSNAISIVNSDSRLDSFKHSLYFSPPELVCTNIDTVIENSLLLTNNCQQLIIPGSVFQSSAVYKIWSDRPRVEAACKIFNDQLCFITIMQLSNRVKNSSELCSECVFNFFTAIGKELDLSPQLYYVTYPKRDEFVLEIQRVCGWSF